LVNAVVKFGDRNRALLLANHSSDFSPGLIPLLQAKDTEQYISRHLPGGADMLEYAVMMKDEWSIPFAKKIVNYVSENISKWLAGNYDCNRRFGCNDKRFFKEHIQHIPTGFVKELKLRPGGDEKAIDLWENTDGYLMKMMNMKRNIYNFFA
jgi:hypothetical protein